MSEPATPTQYKRRAPDSSPATSVEESSLVQTFVDFIAAIEDGESADPVKEVLETIKAAIVESEQLSPSKKAKIRLKVTQASHVGDNLHATAAKLSPDYWSDRAHLWQQPEGPEKRSNSSYALGKISLRGECPAEDRVPGKREIITGNADYTLDYDTLGGSEFEAICVIMEAKKSLASPGRSDAISQAVVYMVGFQQKRMSLKDPKRIIDATYGVVSDGTLWWFLKLSGNFLQFSETFTNSYCYRLR
ncbi:hypothetical protein DTO271G3_3671 [Paecilomyces variotii]|nr:hypothetical protein DTO271G3_3671 [Paecilomyces variotii]